MRKVLKVLLYIIGILLLLVVGAIVYLNTPSGQNFVRGRAEAYLRSKLKTEVRIGHLGYGLPKFIVLDSVLFLDQKKDTLLAANELKIDINMLQLLHKEISVQQLALKGVHSHIYRNQPDTAFNFTYIITAFTGDKPKDPNKPKDTSSDPPLKIELDKVKFDDIHFHFDDYTGGTRFGMDLEHLDLNMKKVDLDKMSFHIKELNVAGLQTTFDQDTSYLPKHPKDTGRAKLTLVADNVDLSRIGFQYNDALNKLLFGLKLGGLQLQLNKFVLQENLVDLKKLALSNTDMELTIGKNTRPPAPIDTIIKKDTTEGWNVKAGNIELTRVNYKMDNENEQHQPKGIDYAHLDVKDLMLSLQELRYTSDSISGNIKHLAVKEKSGINVQELKTVFSYNQQGANLKNLYLLTPNTILQNHLEVHYPSLDVLKKNQQSMQVRINIENSFIGLHDVLIFAPQLEKQPLFQKYRNGRVQIATTLTGTLGNLNIANFFVSGLSNTQVILKGKMTGLPDADKIGYDLAITKLQSSRKDIEQLVPDSLLKSIRIPDEFGITGHVAGTLKDYNTELVLASTDGMAYIKGTLAMSPGKGKEKYDMLVRTSALNAGRILKQDSLMGMVTATITAKGTGFDIKTMNAAVTGDIASAMVKGYRYHDIKLAGNVADKKAKMDMSAADSNLRMQLTGTADFNGEFPAVKADIKLDSIDFRALKLYSTELRARGLIHADFPVLDPDYPKGVFMWWEPVINADGKRYYLDSMSITSRPSKDSGQNITVNMDVLYAKITGRTPLTQIGQILQEHIDRHYTSPKKDSINRSLARLQRQQQRLADSLAGKKREKRIPGTYGLSIQASIIDKPMLHSILPGLISFDSIHIDGRMTKRHLSLNVLIPDLQYGSTAIDNGIVKVNGEDSAFTFKVTADKITQGNFHLFFADIHGNLTQNTVNTTVSLSDQGRKERFHIDANMKKVGDSQIVHLEQGLKLNYKVWDVAAANSMVLANGGFYVRDFEISSAGQSIKANNTEPRMNSPMKIEINKFLLSNITEAISKEDTLLANGVLDAAVTIEQTSPELKLTGNVGISQLSFMNDTLGDLQVALASKENSALETKLTLKGQGNDIALNGNYYMEPYNGNDLDMTLDVNAMALKSFETIAQNQVKNSTGFIRGKLAVKGRITAPEITGELHTDNLVTTVTQLNSVFKMPAEKIVFTKNNVEFKNFSIADSANNKAVINGDVNITDLTEPELNLTVKAKNWRAIHSKAKDNKVFYGDLSLTTNLTIRGPATSPSVEGDLNILKNTNITVVTPESTPEIQSRQGIVVFRNMKDTGRKNVLVPRAKVAAKRRKVSAGSDFNVNITVDKAAQFSLVIDQASGDFLSVKGDATLNAAVNKGGTISLTGSYAVHDGAYQLNYNFIKRKFKISDGSIITFAGDPVKGTTLNVTAVYEANVAPYDLVQRQVPDQAQLNYYKQRIPFNVELHMKGPILKPGLTFDIVLPENNVYRLNTEQIQTVQGKLSQIRTDTSELNKQVFAVLILNRFVSDDPFSSGAASSATYTALQSVSTFIGEQLNQAAGKLVKGIDFSVDLGTTEDYTTGDLRRRTDLNLAASKRLLNDRLKLTIGNDFELEGPQTNNTQSSLVPTNLAADYLLSADGRYTVRGYRKTYDQGVILGYVTETGVNFIVSLDYNKFKRAIMSQKKREALRNVSDTITAKKEKR
ncbi:MAG: hypothetical protein JWQ38_3006 [Flavipsychrobacter sp.]|nr:hypothetical protein [Flavipsychrobacter sp.]